MLDKTCKTFIDELASKAPVPGGGSVCAYVGSLGMALGSMVANLTLGKKKYQDVQEDIQQILSKAEKLIEKMNSLVEDDVNAFIPLSQAYGLPSGTEEEKAIKNETMQNALVDAVIVPLEIARCCSEAIDLHDELEKKGTVIAISDVGVGVLFCKAALQGAKLNVLINTSIMDDSILRDCVLAEIEELTDLYIPKVDEIYKRVEDRINK